MTSEEQVRAERLRLVLDGIAQSLPVGFILSTLLLIGYTLTSGQVLPAISAQTGDVIAVRSSSVHGAVLVGWYIAFMSGRTWMAWFCRRTLRRGYPSSAMPRIVRYLLVSKIYEGVIWGALCWIVLKANTSPGAIGLLLGLMAAVSSNAVPLLSPIMRLYLGLMVPMLLLAAGRFLTMDEFIFRAIGICCLLYVFGQYGQARLVGRSLVNSIRLRFENLDLIASLKSEKEAVVQAQKQAEQANLAKSRFLAAASHDLRQPIHALGLFLEALSCSPLNPTQRQVLDTAKSASVASADMLNTLLDFSRIEAGVIQPKPRPYAIQRLLNKLEIELAPQADAKGLIYRSRETGLIGVFDASLLELILRNLISNAIRYTETGGVLVACRPYGACIAIEIYDTGIGIDPSQQNEIFREFHQLGNTERDRRKGLGLGLAIVDGLARSMGHTLSLRSAPGRGSRFRITVPRAGDAEAPPPGDTVDLNAVFSVRLAGKQVLVVDDDETVQQGMQQVLASWGMHVQAVESFEQAVALAWLPSPDLIVCDYRLRDRQTGGEVIAKLRDHYHRDIPALLVTGDTAPERIRDAAASGIPLLHKPVPADQLRTALHDLIDK